MGDLTAAGCAWSARGNPGYGGKWAWLAMARLLHGKQLSATAGARRLGDFLHYSSSHNRAMWLESNNKLSAASHNYDRMIGVSSAS